MVWLIIIVVTLICVFSARVRCWVLNPLKTILYGIYDLFHYIISKGWNKVPRGDIICFTGAFGKGKTLTAVHYITQLFKKYNGKVYNGKKNRFIILSNIQLRKLPFIEFTSMSQFVDICISINEETYPDIDKYNYIPILLIDEINSIFNNRSFKENFNPTTITSLMQIRKINCSIFCTAQKFQMIDLVFRNVCNYVVPCDKLSRNLVMTYYDAWDYDNIMDSKMLKPVKTRSFFVKNFDYESYDTAKFATYIGKESNAGNMLSSAETIAETGISEGQSVSVKKKWLKSK